MLVEVGVDLDRAGVQAGLVGERRAADVRLPRRRREVRDLGDRVRDPGRVGEQALRQHPLVQLELEVGDDGDEVGVAGALAVPVDRALHVRGAGVDGGQGVGDRAAGVVVAVDADPHLGVLAHVVHDVGDPAGQHAAVGVAERDHLGAGVVRRAQHLERVVAVGAVAVEEVLGVEEDRLALRAQVGDGVADHREVLLERGPQRELDVPVVRLRDQRDHAGAAVAQGRDAAGRRPRVRRPGGSPRRRPASRCAGRARRPRAGRTRCPSGSPRASRPRCSRRRGCRAGARSTACRRPRGSAPPAARRRAGSCRRRGSRRGGPSGSCSVCSRATKKPLVNERLARRAPVLGGRRATK